MTIVLANSSNWGTPHKWVCRRAEFESARAVARVVVAAGDSLFEVVLLVSRPFHRGQYMLTVAAQDMNRYNPEHGLFDWRI